MNDHATQAPIVKAWPYPTLFAHRGGGTLAPENTLAAMKCGYAHGYGAVEFDVKLSADNIAFLLHDDTLDRTTNGQGAAAQTSMADLEKLDAGAWHSNAHTGARVPRFSAIAHYLHGLGLMANVEIKPCPGREAETGKLVAELCAELWRDRLVKPLMTSFSVDALQAARKAAPDAPIGLLVDVPGESHLQALQALKCVSLHCHHAELTASHVRFFHDYGFHVLTYTVNEAARVSQLLAMGVDGIFTDNLADMAKRFPAQLHDGGRAMREEQVFDVNWLNVVPPMP
jgi:glycerophosphoryl diester phosphodiesterase